MSYDIKTLRQILNPMHVLVVDDEKEILDKTSELMAKFFAHVDTANNPQEAIELCRNQDYDLIITDVQMPLMSGWEMLPIILDFIPKVFVVTMSGTLDVKPEHKKLCDVYLKKPVGINEVIDMLNKLVVKKGL